MRRIRRLRLLVVMTATMVLSTAVPAHAATVQWVKQFGTVADDWATAVATDVSGVYVAGSTYGAFEGAVNEGAADAFLRKYQPNGDVVWTRQFGSDADDRVTGVAAAEGPVYVAGSTDGALPGQTQIGETDGFVRKYRASGELVWTRQLGTARIDNVGAVAVDDRRVYVAGYTYVVIGGFLRTDAVVWKLRPSGATAWVRIFGTLDDDVAAALSVGPSGAIFVAGCLFECRGSSIADRPNQAFVRKYSPNGTVLWERRFGSIGNDEATSLAFADGRLYVGGYTSGVLVGQTDAGGADAFVRAFEPDDGSRVWTRQFGTDAPDRGVALTTCGFDVCLLGRTRGAFPDETSAGSLDAFVRAYDRDGSRMWTEQFGTASFDEPGGIAALGDGVAIVGETGGVFEGQSASGGSDAFFAAMG